MSSPIAAAICSGAQPDFQHLSSIAPVSPRPIDSVDRERPPHDGQRARHRPVLVGLGSSSRERIASNCACSDSTSALHVVRRVLRTHPAAGTNRIVHSLMTASKPGAWRHHTSPERQAARRQSENTLAPTTAPQERPVRIFQACEVLTPYRSAICAFVRLPARIVAMISSFR